MRITNRRIQQLKLVNRHAILPSNFVYANDPGNTDRSRRNVQKLKDFSYLYEPEQQKQAANYWSAFALLAVAPKGKDLLADHGISYNPWTERQFWHQTMTGRITGSLQLIAKKNGLIFQTYDEILDGPLSLDCTINHDGHIWGKSLNPDQLIRLGDHYFAIEADCDQEPVHRATFELSSYRRKLLQYREILASGTYKTQWQIPSLFVLHITTGVAHCNNIVEYADNKLKLKSTAQFFKGVPILGSREKAVHPLYSLWDEPFERVGYPPITIKEIVNGGQASKNT